eukprot:765983-Hanusia_phi.AAC.7
MRAGRPEPPVCQASDSSSVSGAEEKARLRPRSENEKTSPPQIVLYFKARGSKTIDLCATGRCHTILPPAGVLWR